MSTPRIANTFKEAPESIKAMMALEGSFEKTIDHKLAELIRMRASQINGCAYCIHLHVGFAKKAGETDMRLHMLPAWRESNLYDARERAALGWTEALTRLSETGAPDEDYEALKAQFTEAEQVAITLLIGSINVWNRLQVGFRAAPGE